MDGAVWRTGDRARVLHLTGVTAALSGSCAALVAEGIRGAVAGALVSFDVNYRPGLWSAPDAAPVLLDLADRADLVFVGLDEGRTLWGTRTPAQIRALLPGPAALVVKDGGTGATAFTPAGDTLVPAPPVQVVEPVGAGDAFAAGYLFGVLRGLDPAASLACGHALAGAALATTDDVGELPDAGTLLAQVAGAKAATEPTHATPKDWA
jgi:2-dehydro-3-deoxygluconokinase